MTVLLRRSFLALNVLFLRMLARRVLSVPMRFAATPAGVPPSLVGDKYEETYGFGFNQDIPADTPAFAEMVAKRNEAAHIAQLKGNP